MTDTTRIIERIESTEAKIGVIGLGYVGLPIGLNFSKVGFEVHGHDIASARVARLQDRDSYVDDVSDDELAAGLEDGFSVDTDPDHVANCDAYVIAVPTGVENGEPSMHAIRSATETVAKQSGEDDTLVVVSSTVYPGATNEFIAPILAEHRPDHRFHLAMVPERINPGGTYEFSEIPLVVGGETTTAREAAQELFESIISDTYLIDSTTAAELTKTLENTYRMVNIALVNELAKLSENLNTDIWDVIKAADTKPFGYQAFYPGPGVGGHCTPVDPQFLIWQGSNHDQKMTLVKQAHQVNEGMPTYVADEIRTALKNQGINLSEATIAVLGVSYKPNIGDVRNSPAFPISKKLFELGATLEMIDPHVDSITICNINHKSKNAVAAIDLEKVDAALLLADHDVFNYDYLERVPLVFDAQNALPETFPTTILTLGRARPKPELTNPQPAFDD